MSKFVIRFLSVVCVAILNVSCVFDNTSEGPDCDGMLVDKDNVVLSINIQPITASASTNPTERIKSLRVVIVSYAEDDTGAATVEYNRLLDISDMTAQGYSRTWTWQSKSATKDILVIANEESAGPGLSAMLASYPEGKGASALISDVEDYSFSPEYKVENGKIYLPYSFISKGLVPKAGVVNDINAWLLPVATKFIFNFTNYRKDAINVNGISMKMANKANYLLARPGPGELTKQYNGQPVSWIDWLAAISRDSWGYPDFSGNDGFNGRVGWIADYEVPDKDDSDVFTFIEAYSEDKFSVKGAQTTEEDGVTVTTPVTHTTQVYYVPESVNFIVSDEGGGNDSGSGNGDNTIKEQRFFLTLLLEDTGVSQAPPFNDVAIPNLGALFRNTYVIIDVNMSEGDIEVYAEIAPWTEKNANGWVEEGDAPANNPFKIKKKW